MASRISQMRNEIPLPQSQMGQQEQLNRSIEQVRGMMAQIKNAPDQQAMLAQLLQSNPNTAFIANMLRSNGNLEVLARQMAQNKNIDIMGLINQLSGGL